MDQPHLTRRGLLLGTAAIAIAACSRGARANGLWYQVEPGDSLSSLSRRSGATVEAIIEDNDLKSIDLVPGTKVWLRGTTRLAPDPLARQRIDLPPEDSQQSKPPPAIEEPPARGTYDLVPRSAWTSEPVATNCNAMGEVRKITVHHTDEHGGMAGLADLEVIRRIERYHRGPEKRWAAIGYHFLVGKDAKVYEGRPARYQGAHVAHNNENNLGISVIGDFNHHLPTPRQLAALAAFLDAMRSKYGVTRDRVFGHRDLNPSICPGDALYGWVRRYKAGQA